MTPEDAPGEGRIVVGIDGSPASFGALSWAAHQADLTSSALEIVMTWQWPASYGWAAPVPDDFDPEEDVRKELDGAVAPVRRAFHELSIDPRVLYGHPAPILTEASKGAELLVVGSRGHGKFVGMLIGSVSEYCAANAHCPVLVHRPRRRRQTPGEERRIVVGVDGSPAADRALDWAVAQARRSAVSLHLVSVWSFPMALGYAFTTSVNEVRQSALDVIDRAMAKVGDVAPGVPVTGEATEQAPAPGLVGAAKGADMLIVGSRGHGGFEGLLLGSVSLYCIRRAGCPVVVVR